MINTILYRNLTNLTKLLSATNTLPTKTLPTKTLPTKTLIKYEMSESHSAKPLIKERLNRPDNKYPHYTVGK
jgi:hypothetical protein